MIKKFNLSILTLLCAVNVIVVAKNPPQPTHLKLSTDTLTLDSGLVFTNVKDAYIPIVLTEKDTSVQVLDSSVVVLHNVSGTLVVYHKDSLTTQYFPISLQIYRDSLLNQKDSLIVSVQDTLLITVNDAFKEKMGLFVFTNKKNVFLSATPSSTKMKYGLDSPYVIEPQLCAVMLNTDSVLHFVPIKMVSTIRYEDKSFHMALWMYIVAGMILLVLIGFAIWIIIKKVRNKRSPNFSNDSDLESESESESESDESGTSDSGDNVGDEVNLQSTNDSLKRENKRLQRTLENLQKEKEGFDAKIKQLKDEHKTELDNEIDKTEHKYQKQLDTKEEYIKNLKNELKEEKDKVNSIAETTRKEMQKKVDDANNTRKEAEEKLRTTSATLKDTTDKLTSTTNKLSLAEDDIQRLEQAQKEYSSKIAFVPFATEYANSIMQLIDKVSVMEEASGILAKIEMEDPYHLYKAVARYKLAMDEINMSAFLAEVQMAAKKQMTFADNGIARLLTLHSAEQQQQLQQYFMLNYLAKYINAVQVFNESMIGLAQLVDEIKEKDVAPFVQLREDFAKLYNELHIKVICPHLFDSTGTNMDLRVEQVDAGFDSGDILEIMNCLVYPMDGQKPGDKIFVKAQK